MIRLPSKSWGTSTYGGISGQQVAENLLKAREAALSAKLFEVPEPLNNLVSQSEKLEKGLLNRMVERLSFKVNHEKREDLREALDTFLKASNRMGNPFNEDSTQPSGKKADKARVGKISEVLAISEETKSGSREPERKIDLNNGNWNTTSDGKKFWISNDNPEVMLTPAEFQRVLISQDEQEK